MNKQELLNFLLENIDCFKDIEESDFYNLLELDSNELSFMNDKVSQITPLLKQICDYAFTYFILNEDMIEEIASGIAKDSNILDLSLEIIEKCYQYIEILIEENCNHPSVLNLENMASSVALYNDFKHDLNELIEVMGENIEDDEEDGIEELIDYVNIIDERLLEILDNILTKLKIKLLKKIILTKEDLILHLNSFAKSYINLVMVNSKANNIYNNDNINITYIDDSYINILKDDRIYPTSGLTLSRILDSYTEIMKIIEEYKYDYFYESDREIKILLKDAKEIYQLYKSYKYKYLKDTYKETRLLEKCKKM